jgi:hypothetical protein
MIFYPKLMALNPTSCGKMINSLGQEIEFYEHPTKGDEGEILCVSHALRLAAYSGFFETCDMEAEHGEYQPSFLGNKFLIGGLEK